ncbi:hypothetical protein F7Q99_12715 [Streptomyces kaniharaensis]|uniref:Sugar phosphotransferase n=1 Tax=Streptomyces kaniharaensis TaxID=212423 RepID=A0A6N7KNJ1_9ACTN|nr:stealth family protein [Streptomyces kaniharaensis]MQS13122.1 hypothetical protein [Streptomyces kaniharaensis]
MTQTDQSALPTPGTGDGHPPRGRARHAPGATGLLARLGWATGRRTASPAPRTREDELLAVHPALVRDAGLLAEVRADLTPAAARAENLTLATAALTGHGIPYVLAEDARRPDEPERHHVAVPLEHRAAALQALETACAGRHVYLEPISWGPGPGPGLAPGLTAAVAAAEACPDQADAPQRLIRGVRVFRPFVTPSRSLRYGAEHGCEIKFWQPCDGPDGGAIVPYGDTRAGWWVPSLAPAARVTVAGRHHGVPAAFARRLVEDVDFPIDAVYTWVDDTDPRWRERCARSAVPTPPSAAGRPHGTEPERFRNRDELRYSLRSLAMYAPWIRHVHLVTDDQVPDWLDTGHPGITVVPHRELFDDPSVLPVFNSRAIESQLHRIEGLTEHFVYFNDDMFLGRELGPGFFFQSNGAARLFQDAVIPPNAVRSEDDAYTAGQKNTRDAVAGRHGRTPVRTFSHAPRAAHRSLLALNTTEFTAELNRTAAETFRAHGSLSPFTLYGYTAYLTGRAVFAEADEVFLDIGRPDGLRRLPELLAERRAAVFCLNDVTTGVVDPAVQDAAVRAFLDAYLPVPGPFEKPVPPSLPQPARPAPVNALIE